MSGNYKLYNLSIENVTNEYADKKLEWLYIPSAELSTPYTCINLGS